MAALLSIWATGDFSWVEENGWVENFQLGLLLAAALVFLWRSFMAPRVPRLLAVGFAAVSAMFFLRELDLRQTWVPGWVAARFHEGHGKDVLIIGIAAFLSGILVVHWRSVIPALRALLRPRGAAYVLPGVLLLTAATFERIAKVYGGETWVALEEIVELNGYALLLLAAVFLPLPDSGGDVRTASQRT